MFLHHTVIVPVNGITKPAAGALVYATTISRGRPRRVRRGRPRDRRRCATMGRMGHRRRVVVLPSPYRSILRPLVDYVDELANGRARGGSRDARRSRDRPAQLVGHLLHNKTALFIRTAFLFRPNVVVTAVPYLVGRAARLRDLAHHDELLEERATA